MKRSFEAREPTVTLRYFTPKAYDDAIAAARTCYSQNVVEAESVNERQRDYIGPLTYDAGHHTVYQHATFEFSLENISRHFIWSVLHNFPFYNSDQQSQRYVRLNEIRAFIPPLEGDALEIYKKSISDSFDTYLELAEVLNEYTMETVGKIRHLDRHPHERIRKKVKKEADKKAIEIARYVLPIATYASLVFTCSGLVLHRLYRLMKTKDLSYESQSIISKMVNEVRNVDPHFFSKVGDEPLEKGEALEDSFLGTDQMYDPVTWDESMGGFKQAKLLSCSGDAKKIIAQSIRFSLGAGSIGKTDDELVSLALDSKLNPYRVEKANLSMHSPIMQSLNHVHYSFLKKLSHSADSQNQRHRMIPGSRPMLALVDSEEPDYFVPMLIQKNPRALDLYQKHMENVWNTKKKLIRLGVPREFAVYILPNAVNLRFVESGSLLYFLHKWTQRTCLNAQEEIFHAAMEQLSQAVEAHPFLSKYLGPPCVVRDGVVSPRCTEGDHFCGVTVWKQFPNISRQL